MNHAAEKDSREVEKMGPLTMHLKVESWPLVAPFRIAGHVYTMKEFLVVTLGVDGYQGRGEAAGVRYRNDTVSSMRVQIEAQRAAIEVGLSHTSLQRILPPGGARNALDCALWDLKAKLARRPVWELVGIEKPKPVVTTFTCSAEDPETMAKTATAYADARAIKLKLTGHSIDSDRVRAVRASRPDVLLTIDANQGFTQHHLDRLMSVLVDTRVELIEQPYPVGNESWLDGFDSPIPIAADETVQNLSDIPKLVGRFSMVNIKLDKCGGLTEGLAMVQAAHDHGLSAMVGNMFGTSLAMAPAYLLGQLCELVDLDGPIFLRSDRTDRVEYFDGKIRCPERLWGGYDGDPTSNRITC